MSVSTPETVVILVDDLRDFRDGRECMVARTSAEAVALLSSVRTRVDELWLDHDLGPGDDVLAVVAWLEEAAFRGEPLDVGRVLVHSANPVGASRVLAALRRWGYPAVRSSTDPLVSAPVPDMG